MKFIERPYEQTVEDLIHNFINAFGNDLRSFIKSVTAREINEEEFGRVVNFLVNNLIDNIGLIDQKLTEKGIELKKSKARIEMELKEKTIIFSVRALNEDGTECLGKEDVIYSELGFSKRNPDEPPMYPPAFSQN